MDSIWAYGLRNPFRAYYDAPTGRLFIGDVGGNDYSTAIGRGRTSARAAPTTAGRTAKGPCDPAYTTRSTPIPTTAATPSITGGFVYHGNAVPEPLPGQLLLRRLHAELDQAPDVRRQRQRQRRLQFRARRRLGRRAVRRHRVSDRRARTARSITSTSATRTSAAPSASARSAASATSQSNQPPIASRPRNPTRARPAHGQLLQRRLVRSRRAATDLSCGPSATANVDRGQPDAHLHAGRSVQARLTVSDGVNSTLSTPLDHQRRQPRRRHHPARRRTAASSAPAT